MLSNRLLRAPYGVHSRGSGSNDARLSISGSEIRERVRGSVSRGRNDMGDI